MTGGYRSDIDGLRALAVVPVVLFHAGVPGFPGGYVGVDIFFVISGFLITGILVREIDAGRFSLIAFYERRARRILPALLAVLAACFAAGAVISPPDHFEDLAISAFAAAAFAANIWFAQLSADYFAPEIELEPLLHTWSLAVEEQFYIVFPLLLMALSRRGRRVRLAAVGAICAVSLGLAAEAVGRAPQAAFYLAHTRAWELGLGALLALGAFPARASRPVTEAVGLAGLGLIAASVALYDAATPFPGLAALPPCLGTAALIWAGGQHRTLARRLLELRPLVAIGLISYSLYLWHWPVLAYLRLAQGTLELPLGVGLAAVAVAVGLAWLSWALIEQPVRRRPPRGPGRRVVFAGAGAGLAAVMALAVVVWQANGFVGRFPPEVQAAFAGRHDINPDRRACFDKMPPQGICVFDGPGPAAPDPAARADLLLWGDSHAAALMPGVKRAAGAAGLSGRFAGRPACAPLLGLDRRDIDARFDCAGFNAAVMAWLRARDDMALVILSARWQTAVESVRPPGESKGPVLWAPAGNRQDAGAGAPQHAVVAEALHATVDAIRATGREVLILGPVPEIGWSVPDGLARRMILDSPHPRAPDQAAVAARHARTGALQAALDARPGVDVLAIAPALCGAGECRIARDGRPLYTDDDHLSRFGAETVLAPLLARYLAQRPAGDAAGGDGARAD